jgi:hypothetical protein
MVRNATTPTVPPTAGPMTDFEGLFMSAVSSGVSPAVDVGGEPVASVKDDTDEVEVGKLWPVEGEV